MDENPEEPTPINSKKKRVILDSEEMDQNENLKG